MYGGTMRISTSVATKCAIPTTKNHTKKNPRTDAFGDAQAL
jgi:hypothetical protein